MNRFRSLPIWSALSITVLGGCQAGPVYRCAYTDQAPVVDGKIDEPAWAKAAPFALLLTDKGTPPRQATTARALWTDTHLYIAFDCRDNDVWASETQRDAPIYKHEVVEAFIDENADGKSYLELEVSPNNTVFDAYVFNPGRGKPMKFFLKDYTCEGLQTATQVAGTLGAGRGAGAADDRGWTVEIAVPFSELILAPHVPPKPGDRWRWNLYRIDRPTDPKDDEYTAWSPTGAINFHRPEKFGWLLFGR